MSDDEEPRSLHSEEDDGVLSEEDGEIEDGALEEIETDVTGDDEKAAMLEAAMMERLNAKMGLVEAITEHAGPDYPAAYLYDDDDDAGPPIEAEEYEPVEYQVTTREPSSLRQIYGDGASAAVELKPELARGLKLHGVHQLVTWTCTDGIGMPPRWAFVRNKPLVSCVILVCAPGVDHARAATSAELMPNIKTHLGTGVPTFYDNPTATEGNVLKSALFSVPTGGDGEPKRGGVARPSNEHRGKNNKKDGASPYGSTDARDLLKRLSDGPHPPEHYLLSPADMAEMDYPIPTLKGGKEREAAEDGGGEGSVGKKRKKRGRDEDLEGSTLTLPDGYVVTQPAGGGIARDPPLTMCAIDCEMCYVGVGAEERLELTRCSVVGPDGSVIYDKLVRPAEAITNYNTAHSGITEAQMRGVTTTLEDVQRELLELVACETILIGHSLENDLKRCVSTFIFVFARAIRLTFTYFVYDRLRMIHARCVDTVALFPHARGAPYRTKLAHLTERYLARKIQEGSHDSVADARATLELALLKFVYGPGFGEPARGGTSLFETLASNGTICSASGPQSTLRECASSGVARCVTTASDEATVSALVDWVSGGTRSKGSDSGEKKEDGDGDEKSAPGDGLFFAHLRGYYKHLEESNKRWAEHTGQAFAAENYESIENAEAVATGDETDSAYCEVEEGIAADAALMDLDQGIGVLWDAMPDNAMLILCTGAGDTPRVRMMQERKWKRSRGLGPWGPFTDEAEDELRRMRDRVSRGVVFAGVKQKAPA